MRKVTKAANALRLLACGIVVAVAAARLALAEDVSDFNRAKSNKDCDSIPYESLRNNCKDYQQRVDDWCKNSSRPIRCDQDLDRRNRDEISKRIDNGEKCVEYRKKVAEIFTDAKNRVGRESDPAIRPIADELYRIYERGEDGHKNSIREYEQAVFNCRALYSN